MVENHYPNLGFTPVKEAETAQYELDLTKYQAKECYITEKNDK